VLVKDITDHNTQEYKYKLPLPLSDMPGANIYTAEMYCAGGLSKIVGEGGREREREKEKERKKELV
jgi:hypothetical protein